MSRLNKQEQIKADQQAELARLRAAKRTKSKASATVVEEAKPAFNAQDEDEQRRSRIESAVEELMEGFQFPSWKRAACATVVGLLLAFGTGWIVGSLVGLIIGCAMALTGMMWLTCVIYILGIVAGGLLGGKVGMLGFGYVANSTIDRHYDSVRSRVANWFTPSIVEFSGAHVA